MIQEWIPLQQAADLAGVNYETMRSLANDGKIKSRRLGNGRTAPMEISLADIGAVRSAYQFRRRRVSPSEDKPRSSGKGRRGKKALHQ